MIEFLDFFDELITLSILLEESKLSLKTYFNYHVINFYGKEKHDVRNLIEVRKINKKIEFRLWIKKDDTYVVKRLEDLKDLGVCYSIFKDDSRKDLYFYQVSLSTKESLEWYKDLFRKLLEKKPKGHIII